MFKYDLKLYEYADDELEDGLLNYYADKGDKKNFDKTRKDLDERRRDLINQGYGLVHHEKDKESVNHYIYGRKKITKRS